MAQRQIILSWLEQKNNWHLSELKEYIEDRFGVVFESKQSYYGLFKEANISWQKTQKKNLRLEAELVAKKN